MFTGIIESVGKVVKYDENRLGIRIPFRHLKLGESISIDGVCLTVARKSGAVGYFNVGPETRRVTTLGRLQPGDHVNLERALRVGDRLGGHWVTGHVECTGSVLRIERSGNNRWVYVKVPLSVTRYIVNKGSLAVDGISLTVVSVRKNIVKIMLVPHTLAHTTLARKGPGAAVNLEADLLAKYALR